MANPVSALQSLNNEFVELTKSSCAPYLEQLSQCKTEQVLRRGERATSVFEVKCCPVDRKPRNTRANYHRAADDWFSKKFGVRYRSSAVFCTSDFDTAEQYESPRFITPIGGFTICWSPKVIDMYFLTTSGPTYDDFINKLENSDYREGDLNEALESDCEIMLHCEGYISTKVPLTELAGS